MGGGGFGRAYASGSNTQINQAALAKAAARAPKTVGSVIRKQQEELVDLNASPFASTIDSPSIGLPEPIKVMGSRTEPDPDFNVADYYERMTARAEESITPEAVRRVLTSHDPNRGELLGTSPSGYLMDQQVGDPFIETIRSKQIPLAKELDTPFELDYDYGYHSDKLYMKQPPLLGNTDLQQGFTDKEREEYRDLMKRGSFVDISGGTSRVGEYTMAWVEDPPEPSGFSKFLNNPVVNVLGAINPAIGLATTAAKAATGEKLSPVEIASGLMTGLNMAGVIKPPTLGEMPVGQAGPPQMTQGTGLFGSTYGQTQAALNVAAAGDAKGAALSLLGPQAVKAAIDKVPDDRILNVLQKDDVQAGLNKVVERVAGGAEFDEALAYGLGTYIKEGGGLNIEGTNVSLGVIEDVVRDIVRPIGKAGTALADFVEEAMPDIDIDTRALRPLEDVIKAGGRKAEDAVRAAGSVIDDTVIQPIREAGKTFDDVVTQPIGDALSDLDTAIRQALPDIDLPSVDLPSMDLPFDLRPSLMSDTGEDFIPSPTRTTDSLFNDELFQFETEIGISDYPIESQGEELELFYPESALQLDYAPDYDNFFENTIYEAKPRSYDF